MKQQYGNANQAKKKLILLFLFILIVPTISALNNTYLSDGGFALNSIKNSSLEIGLTIEQPSFANSSQSLGWFKPAPTVTPSTTPPTPSDGNFITSPIEEIKPFYLSLIDEIPFLNQIPKEVWFLFLFLMIAIFIFVYSDKEKRKKTKEVWLLRKQQSEEKFNNYKNNPKNEFEKDKQKLKNTGNKIGNKL